jgi:hypothetical protein
MESAVMSHDTGITDLHGHSATAPHATGDPFGPGVLDNLHKQDVSAGRAVVVLMCSIFLIGVLIYTIVAISIAF